MIWFFTVVLHLGVFLRVIMRSRFLSIGMGLAMLVVIGIPVKQAHSQASSYTD